MRYKCAISGDSAISVPAHLNSSLCEACGYEVSGVVDSRASEFGRRRRRRCEACKSSWTTVEMHWRHAQAFSQALKQIAAAASEATAAGLMLTGLYESLVKPLEDDEEGQGEDEEESRNEPET